MRMGFCNMIESSEEIGEPRKEKDFVCEWEKAQRGDGAQVEAGSYRKGKRLKLTLGEDRV